MPTSGLTNQDTPSSGQQRFRGGNVSFSPKTEIGNCEQEKLFFFFFAEVSELLGCKSRANKTLHGNELSLCLKTKKDGKRTSPNDRIIASGSNTA